jgi:hypothetical protein
MLHNSIQVVNKSLIVTTRVQLKGYGLTRYQATKITQNLTPISKQGRTYVYSVSDAIGSIRSALTNSRLKPLTRQQLLDALDSLIARLDNLITLPFNATSSTHPEIGDIAKQLLKAISSANTTLVDLKATAATINGKYKK